MGFFSKEAAQHRRDVLHDVFSAQKNGMGYTAVELMVVASIMILITAAVVVGFGTLNSNVALNRAARDLGVALRRAQNMSLAVSGVPAIGNEVPPAVGIQLTVGATSVILFGERSGSIDSRYTASNELIETIRFERGVRIRGFQTVDSPPTAFTPTGNAIHVLFAAPTADPVITDGGGTTAPPDSITAILDAPNGETTVVTIRESGEISVK